MKKVASTANRKIANGTRTTGRVVKRAGAKVRKFGRKLVSRGVPPNQVQQAR